MLLAKFPTYMQDRWKKKVYTIRHKEEKEGELIDLCILIYDLPSGEISQESALCITWQIEEDKLGFQLQLPKKLLTRRDLPSVLSSGYDPLGIFRSMSVRREINNPRTMQE